MLVFRTVTTSLGRWSPLVALVSVIVAGVWMTLRPPRGGPATATDFLATLPTRPEFYLLILVLGVCYVLWRTWQWRRYVRDGRARPAGLTPNMAKIVRLLRQRAFSLETWAHCTLAAIIASLLAGVYFIAFQLQHVLASDFEILVAPQFKSRFGPTLDRIAQGQYWLRVANMPKLAGRGTIAAAFFADEVGGDRVYKGVVARNQGPVFVTDDGGLTWTEANLARAMLDDGEWLVAGAFAKDGSRGVLFGNLGSMWTTKDQGRSWHSYAPIDPSLLEQLHLPRVIENVTEGVATETLAVIKTLSGSTYVNTEGQRSSSRQIPLWGDGAWREMTNLHLRTGPDLEEMALDANWGVIAIYPSLVFEARDGGARWTSSSTEWSYGRVVRIAQKGEKTIVITSKGKQLTMNGHGSEWVDLDLPSGCLQQNEKIHSALPASYNSLVLIGSSGTLITSSNGDPPWRCLQANNGILTNERIVGAVSDDSGEVVLAGISGNYFICDDRKCELNTIFESSNTGRMVSPVPEQNGSVRVLVDSSGVLHTWTGRVWNASSHELVLGGESLIKARFQKNGDNGFHGIVVGSLGSVFTTKDDGKSWSKSGRLQLDGDVVEGGAFCHNGAGVFVTLGGSVWLFDSDTTWRKAKLPLEPKERVDMGHKPAFSLDGQYGLVVGENGSSVTITRDCGRTWTIPPRLAFGADSWIVPKKPSTTKELVRNGTPHRTYWHNRKIVFETGSASPYEPVFAGVAEDGSLFLLRERSDLMNWRRRSMYDIQSSVGDLDVGPEIQEFIGGALASTGGDKNIQRIISDSSFNLLISRGAILAFLFFLLHLLARIYQYTVRLSAFWNSRADAICLRNDLADSHSHRFDDLVHSLAPDEYHFGRIPGFLLGTLRTRQQRGD